MAVWCTGRSRQASQQGRSISTIVADSQLSDLSELTAAMQVERPECRAYASVSVYRSSWEHRYGLSKLIDFCFLSLLIEI